MVGHESRRPTAQGRRSLAGSLVTGLVCEHEQTANRTQEKWNTPQEPSQGAGSTEQGVSVNHTCSVKTVLNKPNVLAVNCKRASKPALAVASTDYCKVIVIGGIP